jgi:hypothetical protein
MSVNILNELLFSYTPKIAKKDRESYRRSIAESSQKLSNCDHLFGYWNDEIGQKLFSVVPVKDGKLSDYWVWAFRKQEIAQDFANHLKLRLDSCTNT